MKPGLRGSKDFLAGLLFLAVGAGAMVVARDYPFGTAMRMGSGNFPTVLGAILVLFGVFLMARGASTGGVVGSPRWARMARIETDPNGIPVARHIERELRGFLECGILAFGFARARCDDCGHDFLVAFSCKGRGLCPSCTTRRMVETAAHLIEHVLPQVPVCQWVVTLPKRLRCFLHRDPALLARVRRSVLRTIEAGLRRRCPGAPRGASVSSIWPVGRGLGRV